jgi:hypothetical protein
MTGRAVTHPKTVIFLGAGASSADGAPVQASLFREYFQCRAIQDHVPCDLKESLRRYFAQIWGINVESNAANARFPTFEEALSILDIADARKESFRGMGDDPLATGEQVLRSNLAFLIYLILNEKLREQYPNHLRLVQELMQAGQLGSTVFVSLNYDIMIDSAIEDANRSPQRLPNYGVKFSPRPNSGGRPFPRAGLLLKLHGSLNWFYCPTCNTLELFVHHKVMAELSLGRMYCSKCHGIKAPIIIPPTFFKVMSNFYLQQLWKRAEDELKKARRIVFCGYSFPDADMHIRYLLKRAEVNRTGQPPHVFIVNEHPKKRQSERKLECGRYKRLFRQKDRVHWTKLSFEQFAENPQLIEDPAQWL